MAPVYSRPWKSYPPLSIAYRLYNLLCLAGKLPFLLVLYALSRSARPHPTFSVQTSIAIRLLYGVIDGSARTEQPVPLSLEPGKEKDRFKVCEPYPSSLYVGPLAAVPQVRPAKVGGTWFPNLQVVTAKPTSTTVLYHIHGGAWILGDGRTEQVGAAAEAMIKHAGVDAVFSLQYRLAARPGAHPFPAALQDVLTGYLYLTRTLAIPAHNIVLSGDSAGGNLAIAFLRYLANHGDQTSLPNPRAALLFSPWISPVDNTTPHGDLSVTTNPNFNTDYLPPAFIRWGALAYSAHVPASDPYITHRGHPFRLPVPTWVVYGTLELLEIDGTAWVKEMQAAYPDDEENSYNNSGLEVYYEENAPHDTLLLGVMLGMQDSFRKVAIDAGRFLKEHPAKT
ncbi:Alpha/Beta hydrolase protein [Microdochium trichocladiopsis]|uniref:Alpha/Beta hydrolase protein n=1 Tax=Microdochium trichocladiopsis TaxID=1682393 RepID=A0A9P8Y9V1_9PEZI|nr:Alpha/Beta hydrolase protein [Microdochium trichocladiopsis]KAH7034568.1 Alpha/Beta hydrolase protein [Microdochium trichocladiopsis]